MNVSEEEESGGIDPKILSLIKEIESSRTTLLTYVSDVESLLNKISSLFPVNLDFRNKHVLEDKLKVSSSFYTTLLNLRQEIHKSLKDEIELRRKTDEKKRGEEIDIRALADAVEKKLTSEIVAPPKLSPDLNIVDSDEPLDDNESQVEDSLLG